MGTKNTAPKLSVEGLSEQRLRAALDMAGLVGYSLTLEDVPEEETDEVRSDPGPSGESGEADRQLSEAQTMLVELVNRIAINKDGETSDVLKSGSLEIQPDSPEVPGVLLTARVIDTQYIDGGPPIEGYVTLRITGSDQAQLEDVSIEIKDRETQVLVGDLEFDPYDDTEKWPHGAPDYAILSFFDRYGLHDLKQNPQDL